MRPRSYCPALFRRRRCAATTGAGKIRAWFLSCVCVCVRACVLSFALKTKRCCSILRSPELLPCDGEGCMKACLSSYRPDARCAGGLRCVCRLVLALGRDCLPERRGRLVNILLVEKEAIYLVCDGAAVAKWICTEIMVFRCATLAWCVCVCSPRVFSDMCESCQGQLHQC